MKIKFNTGEDGDGYKRHELIINDSLRIYVGSLTHCPEDAIIGRDLIDGNQILRYMKMAYEAGKNGEELVVESGKMDE